MDEKRNHCKKIGFLAKKERITVKRIGNLVRKKEKTVV